eukprot:9095962-Pyramimonas_sp.AAC.1
MLFAAVGGCWRGMARMGELKYSAQQGLLCHICPIRLFCLCQQVSSGSMHCGGQAGSRQLQC